MHNPTQIRRALLAHENVCILRSILEGEGRDVEDEVLLQVTLAAWTAVEDVVPSHLRSDRGEEQAPPIDPLDS